MVAIGEYASAIGYEPTDTRVVACLGWSGSMVRLDALCGTDRKKGARVVSGRLYVI